jgi:hypothetical protein
MTHLTSRLPLPAGALPLLEKVHVALVAAWRYARPEFLYLSWVTMEVALLTPAVLAFMPWTRFYPPLAFMAWMFLVILIPFNLGRLMSLAKWPLFRQQNIILLAFLVTLLVTLHVMLFPQYAFFSLDWLGELGRHFTTPRHPFLGRDLWTFFLLAILWWRGIAIAGRRIDINELGLRVRLGALIFMPMVVVLAILRLPWSPTPFVLLFALAAMMSIALTRAEQLEQERTGRNYPMRPRWVLMVFGTSLLIISLSWTVAAVLSGEQLPFFLRWLHPLWTSALFSGAIIFTTITYLTIPIVAVFERLAFFINTRILNRQPPDLAAPAAAPSDNAAEVNEAWSRLLEWLSNPSSQMVFVISRIVLFAILLLVIVLILLLLDRYMRSRRAAFAGGEVPAGMRRLEEDLEPEGFGRRILRRLGLMRQFRAASVRRLYRQMCRAAATHGYPRTEAETPYEYLSTLAEAWPEGRPEARQITEAYVRVRYGEVPETRAEFNALRDAWHRLEKQKPVDLSIRERKVEA